MFDKKNIKKIIIFITTVIIALTVISFLLSTSINFATPVVYLIASFGFNHIGNTFVAQFGTVEVNNFCSGFYSIVFFLAIILSPITIVNKKRRIYLAVFGSLFLYVLNFIRTLLIVILSNYTSHLESLHMAGWILMSVAIFFIWYIWGWEKK